jgi:hypothetical protein
VPLGSELFDLAQTHVRISNLLFGAFNCPLGKLWLEELIVTGGD